MDEALPTTSSSATANVPSGNRAIDFLPPYRVPDDDCLTCRTTLHNCAVDGGEYCAALASVGGGAVGSNCSLMFMIICFL